MTLISKEEEKKLWTVLVDCMIEIMDDLDEDRT